MIDKLTECIDTFKSRKKGKTSK